MKAFASAVAAILVGLSAATPIANSAADAESHLEKRTNAGVYICNNANFGAPCVHLSNPTGDCINFDSNFNDQISAIGPDSGFRCYFHVDYGCSGSSIDGLQSPGISNLGTYDNGAFNDKLSSYFCTT